jgi:hypothetical protein
MAGRPPTYQADDERPVSVSLRIPKALYAQVQQRVHMRRMRLSDSIREILYVKPYLIR